MPDSADIDENITMSKESFPAGSAASGLAVSPDP
jgi:hypothetical protein